MSIENTEFVQAPQDALDLKSLALPDGIPDRARVCIALRGFGLPISTIAKHMGGISENSVRYYLKKYDPANVAVQMSERRKLYLSAMFETVAMTALSDIKASDIGTMSVKDKINLAQICTRAIKEIGAKPPEPPELSEEDLVDRLKMPITETEFSKSEGAYIPNVGRRGAEASGPDGGGAGPEPERDGEQDAGPTDGAGEDSDGASN